MRVSKIVREYIEKKVWEKFPQSDNEIRAEQVSSLVSKANQEMLKLMSEAKQEIANQIVKKYGLTEEMGKQDSAYHEYRFSTWNSPIECKANTDKEKRRKAVSNKIEEIIIALELGGTKADLEKMLAEI